MDDPIKLPLPADLFSIISCENGNGKNCFYLCKSAEEETGLLAVLLFNDQIPQNTIRVNGVNLS